ncbi:hypothetical protein H7170_00005 [Candidatus Gracilibacteria bacterium]|nr:hypothetical protein [Candidatus Gracilibacteria bacterium]
MRGPCMSGYHVPTIKEWCDAIDSINNTSNCNVNNTTSILVNNLKMPLSGYRDSSTTAISTQGMYEYYWTSTPYLTNVRYVFFGTSYVNPIYDGSRSYGLSVRCMHD